LAIQAKVSEKKAEVLSYYR